MTHPRVPQQLGQRPGHERPRKWLRWLPQGVALAVALALVLVIVALMRGADTTGTTGTTSGTTTAPVGASAGQAAPDFTLTTLHGAPFHLADQRGHVVVLFFMATTCGDCVQGSRDLAQAIQAARVPGAQAVAIDVNPGDSRAGLAAFVQSTGVPAVGPVIWGFDPQGTIAQQYVIQALDTTMVIDPKGRIAYRKDSLVPPAQLAQLVRSLA